MTRFCHQPANGTLDNQHQNSKLTCLVLTTSEVEHCVGKGWNSDVDDKTLAAVKFSQQRSYRQLCNRCTAQNWILVWILAGRLCGIISVKIVSLTAYPSYVCRT